MTTTLWVGLGGAVGSMARYLLGTWLQRIAGVGFPWGTLAVNLIGSFVIAVILAVAAAAPAISPVARIALTAGVTGGFTTYSAFNQETLLLLQQGAWTPAAANVGATLLGCLAAGALGLLAGRLLTGG